MTKSERRIRRAITKWVRLLGLTEWDITVELVPIDKLGDMDDGLSPVADCESSWEYQQATIRFHDEHVASASDTDLEHDVIHELQHCMLAEMRDYGNNDKHEERTAVMLTRAFLRAAA